MKNPTLARRLMKLLRDQGPLSPTVITELPEPKPTPMQIQAAVDKLANRKLVKLIPTPIGAGAGEFYAMEREGVANFLEDTQQLPYVCDEVLDLIYQHESKTNKDKMMFGLVKELLSDIPEAKLIRACKQLAEKGALDLTLAGNGVYAIKILASGRDQIHGVSEPKSHTIINSFNNNQNSAVSSHSPGSHQTITVTNTGISLGEIATLIREVIIQLPNYRLPEEVERKVQKHLTDAAEAVDEKEPDLEYAKSSVVRALKFANEVGTTATGLAISLNPIVTALASYLPI